MNEEDQRPLGWLLYWGFGGRVDMSPLEKAVIWWNFATRPVIGWVVSLFANPSRNNGS